MKVWYLLILLFALGLPQSHFAQSVYDRKCNILFSGKDPNTGQIRKELERQHLTAYTHPEMRNSFNEKPFLACEASLSRVGGYDLVNLFITIESKKAQQTYGSIAKGAFLLIQFIDGEKIHAYNVNTDYGVMNPYKNSTTYQTSFTLESKNIKDLSKKEVDRIGILWTTGFEDYEVYDVDFFIDQVECLNWR